MIARALPGVAGLPGHLVAARRELALMLEILPPTARVEAMRLACIDQGGTYIPLQADEDGAARFPEISLLCIWANGTTEAEAVANWIKAVARVDFAAGDAA